jgi:ankyrin repeat protein
MKKQLILTTIAFLCGLQLQAMDLNEGAKPGASSALVKTYNQEATEAIWKLITTRKAYQPIDLEALKKLLAAGADPNAQIAHPKLKNEPQSLLHWAVIEGISEVEFYALMIKAGANPLVRCYANTTPYFYFIWINDLGKAQRNLATFRGAHRILSSSDYKQAEADVEKLEAVADYLFKVSLPVIDAQNNQGDTALMHAIGHGHTKIAELLVNAKGQPNLQNNKGVTALMFAAAVGNSALVELLLEKNANPRLQNKEGETALMIAQKYARTHQQRIIDMLQKAEKFDAEQNA